MKNFPCSEKHMRVGMINCLAWSYIKLLFVMHLLVIWLVTFLHAFSLCLWKQLSVDHDFLCPQGGFQSICHNEVRDLTAKLLSEVCHNVEVKPNLQPLNCETFHYKTANTQNGARLDISVNGFWSGNFENFLLT